MKEETIDRETCEDENKSPKRLKKENQTSIFSRNGKQSRPILRLKPPKSGSTAPADIRTILLKIVNEYRKMLMERDHRVGKEMKHVLNLKTDEEIIDKILSMSDAEKLKDLHRLVDGSGYDWEEFTENNDDVSDSKKVGIYLSAAPLGQSEEVKLSYVGETNSSFRRRYRAHMDSPIKINDVETGTSFFTKFYCTALLETTRTELQEDKFIQSLQEGLDMTEINKKRKRDYTAGEESISYFLKTVEAIFIGLYFTCQTCQWFNIRMQKCMPYATNVAKGLNMRPSLAHGEIPALSEYIQKPRLEEEEDIFKSKKSIDILKDISRGIKELKRRSIMGNNNPNKEKTKKLGEILSDL